MSRYIRTNKRWSRMMVSYCVMILRYSRTVTGYRTMTLRYSRTLISYGRTILRCFTMIISHEITITRWSKTILRFSVTVFCCSKTIFLHSTMNKRYLINKKWRAITIFLRGITNNPQEIMLSQHPIMECQQSAMIL